MNRQLRLHNLLSEQEPDAPLIDIGTTFMTGLQLSTKAFSSIQTLTADPVKGILALDTIDSLDLGSDFSRVGLLFPRPKPVNGQITDSFGIQWSGENSEPIPITYPLETADINHIGGYPKPIWDQPIQSGDTVSSDPGITIADAPCPGIFNLSLMLRNPWQFLQDVTDGNHIIYDLLEWSTKVVIDAYSHLLDRIDRQPDIIVYGDDLGTMENMFLSPFEFRKYILPHLKILLDKFRQMTSAVICFHSCGAIKPILPDLADLGIEIYNLETAAKNMAITKIRTALPSRAVLHGATDICTLGMAVTQGDKATTARLITEIAQSTPTIAAPLDSMATLEQVGAAKRGAAFIRFLGNEGFDQINRYGPVRMLIEKAMTDIQKRRIRP